MGLAASQARFLCLTARKADCEHKSLALAQEKLNITEKMSLISNEYAQAMNATKLMWSPDGMAGDFGLSYGLLMTPSAANDYDPYMITTPSGAIVLNSAYKAAAEAAGIDKMGGVGSLKQRDKFISALIALGVVTSETAKSITGYDYEPTLTTDKDGNMKIDLADPAGGIDTKLIDWQPHAGLGDEPKVKGGAAAGTLEDLILSENIGQKLVDWASILVYSDKQMSETEYESETKRLSDLYSMVKNGLSDKASLELITAQLVKDMAEYSNANVGKQDTQEYKDTMKKLELLDKYVIYYNNDSSKIVDDDGSDVENVDGSSSISRADAWELIKKQIEADYKKYADFDKDQVRKLEDGFNIKENDLDYGDNGSKTYSIVVNGVINHYKDELKSLTLGDILSNDIVLMANTQNYIKEIDYSKDPPEPKYATNAETPDLFSKAALKLLDKLAGILGYNSTGYASNVGLNVDDASSRALSFAYSMTKNTYLKVGSIEQNGSRGNDHAMTENSAYLNANTYNRLGALKDGSDYKYLAVDLSHMMEVFLTYYENALSGSSSPYVVGKSMDTSKLVTDNSAYKYIMNDQTEEMPMEQKNADFFDKLYNNILEHGWRYDAAIDDSEYLETVLKNGRYSMSSLNADGYYYQTRYNETGYMVEVSDTDAIARAEAEFKAMKAELTFKEDEIDLKTKKLDAEIASISAEVDSVKNIITKSIEKTFTMFSS